MFSWEKRLKGHDSYLQAFNNPLPRTVGKHATRPKRELKLPWCVQGKKTGGATTLPMSGLTCLFCNNFPWIQYLKYTHTWVSGSNWALILVNPQNHLYLQNFAFLCHFSDLLNEFNMICGRAKYFSITKPPMAFAFVCFWHF